jgi:hypothetical protein
MFRRCKLPVERSRDNYETSEQIWRWVGRPGVLIDSQDIAWSGRFEDKPSPGHLTPQTEGTRLRDAQIAGT